MFDFLTLIWPVPTIFIFFLLVVRISFCPVIDLSKEKKIMDQMLQCRCNYFEMLASYFQNDAITAFVFWT